jgi:molybdate transport system substrate-binding protein
MLRRFIGFAAGFSVMSFAIASGTAGAAEITVFCTQALRTSLLELAPRFEAATGHKVTLEVAPSGQLVKRVRAGETADVLIANAPNIDELSKDGKIVGTRTDIARAQVGLAIKAGGPRPDISTPDAVKRALLDAKAVAYVEGGLSGTLFEAALNKLGILDEIKKKAKIGSPAAKFVVSGEAALAAQQISELIAVQGAELLGPMPAELEVMTQFSVGVLAGAKEPAAAKALIAFLRSPEAQAVIKEKGLTPG